jgi:hypothetical protein
MIFLLPCLDFCPHPGVCFVGITSRRNIAGGEKHTPESVQKRAWLHGTASLVKVVGYYHPMMSAVPLLVFKRYSVLISVQMRE